MEAILLLVNFLAMLIAVAWSARAEGRPDKFASQGLFAYTATPGAPKPASLLPRHRRRR